MYFLLIPLFIFNIAFAQAPRMGINNVVDILSRPQQALNPLPPSTCPMIYIDKDIHRGGCPELKKNPSTWNNEIMFSCFQYLRSVITNGKNKDSLNRDQVLSKLYQLEPHEQELMGMVLTSYGEVRGSDINESFLVMQTLLNRAKTAQKRGCKLANALDTATQNLQFSVWNRKDPNWKKAVSLEEEEYDEEKKMRALLNVYKRFKNNDFKIAPQDKATFEKITHFRTKKIPKVPEWGGANRAIKTIRLNGKDAGSTGNMKVLHYFFKDTPWSFRYNINRPQRQGEEACY